MPELTDKQKAFVQEYLIDLNATQAAIRAGYSKDTASEQGYQLLHKTSVKEAIDIAKEERARRTEITADRVLEELAKLAFSNLEDYVEITDDGLARVDLSAATRDQMAAIGEITVDTRKEYNSDDERAATIEKVKFKLSDKGVNLERLGKHLKLFTDKTETDTSVNITISSQDAETL